MTYPERTHVTVYHNDSGLMLHKEIAEKFGLQDWQSIDTPLFWQVLRENAALTIAKCAIELAKARP